MADNGITVQRFKMAESAEDAIKISRDDSFSKIVECLY